LHTLCDFIAKTDGVALCVAKSSRVLLIVDALAGQPVVFSGPYRSFFLRGAQLGRARKPYSRLDREVVLNHLPDVLSIDKAQAEELIDKYADEIPALAQVLLGAGTDSGRQWATEALAKIPRHVCNIQDYGCVISMDDANLRSSLKFLASTDNVDLKNKSESPAFHAETYRAIHRGLYSEFRKLTHHSGGELGNLFMSWFDAKNSSDENFSRRPWSSDTNFGRVLFFIDNELEGLAKNSRSQWSESFDVLMRPPFFHGPDFDFYKDGLDVLINCLNGFVHDSNIQNIDLNAMGVRDDWRLADAAKIIDSVPDNLFLRFGANLSANRALHEYVAQNKIHQDAYEMLYPCVSALNDLGIDQLPVNIPDMGFDDCEGLLRALLMDWFGPKGALLGKHPFFRKPMLESDINVVLQWTCHLRDEYTCGRGIYDYQPAQEMSKNSSSNPTRVFYSFHRFILAVVMVAAYFAGRKLEVEIAGAKNRMKSVFPARGSGKSAPSVHVEEVFLAAFGQIFYSNADTNISAFLISHYASHRNRIRNLKMLLLWRCVKDRTSRELVSIFFFLQLSLFGISGEALEFSAP